MKTRRQIGSHLLITVAAVSIWPYVARSDQSAASPSAPHAFTADKTDRGVTVNLDGQLFTEYLIQSGKKPILWPIIGPTGKKMTRSYPMENVEGEKKDHTHQRSLWFSFGDVNGKDLWREIANTGSTVHREFSEVSGGSTAKIVTINDWLDPEGKKLCEDRRAITCSADGDARIIDFDITITAAADKVTFGDTKEGMFGIRVNEDVKVEAKKGGRIVNSDGLTDADAWAKAAAWVDYYGPIEGETLGVAVLNHPSSFRYPSYWHVRTYGLLSANPFGLHDFTKAPLGAGSHTLNPGESMTFRYRVVLHKGDEKEGRIAERFADYAKQP